MNQIWEVVARVGWEGLTALATVAGAGIVVWQLHFLRKQVTLQNYSDYTKRYQEIVLNFPEDINDKKFILNKVRPDYYKTMRYMRSYFDLCFEEWDLHRRKLIDDRAWDVWEGGIRTAMEKPAFQQAWKIVKESGTEYGEEFETFIIGRGQPKSS